jgi:3-phenylpropionate/trans-cinnamate dioxygenase ferredoxin component
MSFARACTVSDVADGTALAVRVDGEDIAIVRDGEELYAVRDECSHASIPLSEGEVEGSEIECWLHGSRFDLRTGEPLQLPATEPVPIYPVTVEGDSVLVDVANPSTKTAEEERSTR